MARSPLYVAPEGTEDQALVGVKPCGCITAAFAVRPPKDWPHPNETTQAQVTRFYSDMAKQGKTVAWMDNDEIRRRLFGTCEEQHAEVRDAA